MPVAVNFNVNQDDLKVDIDDMQNHYKVVYFQPNIDTIKNVDLNTCFTSSEYDPTSLPINMVPINQRIGGDSANGLHTPDSCKLNAGLLHKQQIANEQKNIQSGVITKQSGLGFNIVKGYFNNDPMFFLNASKIDSGITTDFTDINAATNSKVVNYTEPYSVEWVGYFIPSKTGTWVFSTNNTNAAFVWVGDNAINDYTQKNSFVNNQDMHNVLYKENSSFFIQGKHYFIRVQFGQNYNATPVFNLQIAYQDGTKFPTKDNNLLYMLLNANGSLYEKELTYYAIGEKSVDSTNKGLYNCYVNAKDDKASTYNKLKKKENQYNYKIIWNALTDTTQINPNNYLLLNDKNELCIYNNGTAIKVLGNTTTGKLALSNTDGDLYIENTPGEWQNITHNDTAAVANSGRVANVIWSKSLNNPSNNIIIQKNVQYRSSGYRTMLISNNNMYKLELTPEGNLSIKISIESCSGKIPNTNLKYVKIADSNGQRSTSFYPYRADATELIDEMYLSYVADPTDQMNGTLLNIPLTGDAVKPTNTYMKFSEYYPNNTTGAIDMLGNNKSCNQLCTDDASCKHFYDYTQDGRKYCLLNNKTHLPSQFLPNQKNNNMLNSALYVRDVDMGLDKADVRSTIPRIKVTEPKDYELYSGYKLLDGMLLKSDPYSGLNDKLVNKLKIEQKFLAGKEGFDNHGYANAAQFDKYITTGNPSSIPNAISDAKIKPLQGMATDYSALLNQISEKESELNKKIPKITNSSNTGIRDVMMNDANNKYDYVGDKLNYKNKRVTIQDARQDDVDSMILRQNEVYILGSITIATLVVAAIYISK